MVSPNAREGGSRSLPINLLLKGRLCLLVGAGHVAARKCRTLLDHGARVVLVAPETGGEIPELERGGRVAVISERYRPEVLERHRPFLVYAATDDDDLNRRIVTDAAALGILASAASCWEEGDFISPSVIPWGRGQVSVSTDGASCRQAKFMRMRLSSLLGGERDWLLVGVDVRSLSIEEFGTVRPDAAGLAVRREMLRHLAALEEFALLATCNRLELYAYAPRDASLVGAISAVLRLTPFEGRLTVLTGEDVLSHAAAVVAGRYSQVAGETQIVGQFRSAFQAAFEGDCAGSHLQVLHDHALALGKKIRAAAGTEEHGLPERVADEVSRRLATAGQRVALLGAGMLARAVAARLAEVPGARLTWANRTVERIPLEPVAERVPLDDALGRLSDFDVVVCVVGATGPVLRAEHLPAAGTAPVLIDLGVPRNVDPSLRARPGLTLLTIESFASARGRRGASALCDAPAGSGVDLG